MPLGGALAKPRSRGLAVWVQENVMKREGTKGDKHMRDDLRERLRKDLLESYLHRHVDACACAMCGRRGIPLAFHVIEKTVSDEYGKSIDMPFERGFEPFASMMPPTGYIRGSFPLCTACAPPCKKCKLPTDPPPVHKFAISVQGKIGLGTCHEHIHWFVVIGVARHLWRKWTCPARILAEEAAWMGWIAAGIETRVNYKNTKLSRHGMISIISHRDRNVELYVPPGPHRFKNFVELEQWFATPMGKLSKDMAECMAEADAAATDTRDVPASPEALYAQEVDDCIRMMGERGDIALHAQLNPDFMTASYEVYKVGFVCNVPANHVGGFIAEAAASYQSNPVVGIKLLERTRDRIPQLWPEIKKSAE